MDFSLFKKATVVASKIFVVIVILLLLFPALSPFLAWVYASLLVSAYTLIMDELR
jgi:hypothetical protein